jgi:hypothetical protein
MNAVQLLIEGARTAATLVPFLFVMQVGAAEAQLPRTPVAEAVAATAQHESARHAAAWANESRLAEALASLTSDTALTLVAQHHDLRVAGPLAQVRTLLTLRNESDEDIAAHYVGRQPLLVGRNGQWFTLAEQTVGEVETEIENHGCGDGDLDAMAAEFAETGERGVALPRDVIRVRAGEEIVLEIHREVPVTAGGAVQRVSLPLASDRDAPMVPRLSADVLVESPHGLRRLASPTHTALVDGLHEPLTLLSVDPARVHRGTQLIVEFEPQPGVAVAASTTSSTPR